MESKVPDLQALLRNASNLSAVARASGINLRTVIRIRDGDIADPRGDTARRVKAAARKYQKPPTEVVT